jgi:hypothetical protein
VIRVSHPVSRFRRTRSLLLIAAAVVVAPSCGVTGDSAATIDSAPIARSELETVIADLAAVGQTAITSNGMADAEFVRSVLTSLIIGRATDAVLADLGLEVTDNDRQFSEQRFDQAGGTGYSDNLREVIIRLNSAVSALDRAPTPSPAEVQRNYERRPASIGMLCLRHIIVAEQSTARKAMNELGTSNVGDDEFAAAARRYSIEPNAPDTGGALRSADGDCIALNEYQESFDDRFLAGALQAAVARPFGPVRSSFGYHVIYVRPYSAVADSIASNYDVAAGDYRLLGALADADIRVDSAYGRWDPLSGAVVAN